MNNGSQMSEAQFQNRMRNLNGRIEAVEGQREKTVKIIKSVTAPLLFIYYYHYFYMKVGRNILQAAKRNNITPVLVYPFLAVVAAIIFIPFIVAPMVAFNIFLVSILGSFFPQVDALLTEFDVTKWVADNQYGLIFIYYYAFALLLSLIVYFVKELVINGIDKSATTKLMHLFGQKNNLLQYWQTEGYKLAGVQPPRFEQYHGNANLANEVMFLSNKTSILQANILAKTVSRGKKTLLQGVNLDIKQGSLVALLGTTGAGKSTLMNCLNGMDTKGVNGQVMFYDPRFGMGLDLIKKSNFDKAKPLIGSVPQANFLHEDRNVVREIMAAAKDRLPSGTTKFQLQSRVDRVLELLGLQGVKEKLVKECSGGEQRRITIATELVADRSLLCLDEPEAGLDAKTKEDFFKLLRRLAHDEGKTIIVISHDVSYIDMFDQVIFLQKNNGVGMLAANGTPNQLRQMFNVNNFADIYSLLERSEA